MAIFPAQPSVNPLEKCQFFDFLDFLFLQLRKTFRFAVEYQKKNIFLAYIALKKKLEKWPFLHQNHGLTPLKKKSICRLFGVLVFIAQKSVFSFQNILKGIFLAYIEQKKKLGKMAIFVPKPWANLLGKMTILNLFGLLVFIAQKGVFSFQNNTKDIFLAYIA